MKASFFAFIVLATAGALVAAQTKEKPAAADAKAKSERRQTDAPEADDQPAADQAKGGKGQAKAAKKPAKKGGLQLSTPNETELLKSLSYITGFREGHQVYNEFKNLDIELDVEELVAAFRAGVEGKEPVMTDEEMQELAPQLQKMVGDKITAKRQAVAERNKEVGARNKQEGDAFLAANKKKEGVKTLPSGLQYKVLKSGKGPSPKKTDQVVAHYKGTLIDGTEFDSTYRAGKPATFAVTKVIKGWTEALQLMKVGDKWQLFVPAELAYEENPRFDDRGREVIPPNSTLIFEVELLSVEKGGKTPPLKQ